jgi:hypothetical protein
MADDESNDDFLADFYEEDGDDIFNSQLKKEPDA